LFSAQMCMVLRMLRRALQFSLLAATAHQSIS
jgi:hypothetical protein